VSEQLYAELEQKVRALRPNEDLAPLEKAYRLAAEAHKDQIRDSGEPYINHPLHVALILADMQLDLVCLETGLLHDTVEDTKLSLDTIRKEFGDEVALYVDGITKLADANPFDYLTELQRHAIELAANPSAWMPWNYTGHNH